MKCSIIIPCYNESANLPTLIDRLNSFKTQEEMEFVLVENGSADDSYRIMQDLTKSNKLFKIVKVEVNQGYGYGLKQGLKAATGDYIGWLHADMQLGMNELGDFVSYLTTHKYPKRILLKANRNNRSMMDYFFTFGQAVFDTILFGTLLNDIAATPVLFDADLLKAMKQIPDGFEIDLYTYLIAKREKFDIQRIPVKQLRRVAGKSSWNTGIKSRIKLGKRVWNGSLLIKKSLK